MPEIVILEKSVTVNATPAKIFKALITADELEKWSADHAQADPKIGGSIACIRGEREMRGVFKRLIPNKEVAIEWDRHDHILPEDLTVFRLEKTSKGTKVFVDDFALPEEVARIDEEWNMQLKRLKKVYQSAAPKPKATAKAKAKPKVKAKPAAKKVAKKKK